MPEIKFRFLGYGEELIPQQNTIILDVGKKLDFGILDHHQKLAPNECAASLVVKYPQYILEHLKGEKNITIITHKYPDFDAVASSYLTKRLIETGKVSESMIKIAQYAKIVDSANLPINIPLEDTPYAILYSLFHKINYFGERKDKIQYIGEKRMQIGFSLLSEIEVKVREGIDVSQSISSLSGFKEYEKARQMINFDYMEYLTDVKRAGKGTIKLLREDNRGLKSVDFFYIINPKSYLLKDWIKRDFKNSPSGKGFSLIISSLYEGNFMIATSPLSETYLKGLGELINNWEKEKREKRNIEFLSWYEGDSPFFNYRIIASPGDGTILTREELLDIFRGYLKEIAKN
jgi:hypothetical protein